MEKLNANTPIFNYCKFGRANTHLADCIAGRLQGKQQKSMYFPFFFSNHAEQTELLFDAKALRGDSSSQIAHLYASAERPKQTFFCTINEMHLHIFRPTANVQPVADLEPPDGSSTVTIWKLLPIEYATTATSIPLRDCDYGYMLLAMSANRYLNGGTCRQINASNSSEPLALRSVGYTLALCRALLDHGDEKARTLVESYLQRVYAQLNSNAFERNIAIASCFSSVGFETLIAKIYEAKGYFVPCNRGGTIANVDLMVRENSSSRFETIQVKVFTSPSEIAAIETASEVDYFVSCRPSGANSASHTKFIDWIDLLKSVPAGQRRDELFVWIRRCLGWLPGNVSYHLQSLFFDCLSINAQNKSEK